MALNAGDKLGPYEIVAPLGASAVLIFAVPASPLAQPWSVVGGNILSSLIGVAACQMIPDMMVAAGVAVGVAVRVAVAAALAVPALQAQIA